MEPWIGRNKALEIDRLAPLPQTEETNGCPGVQAPESKRPSGRWRPSSRPSGLTEELTGWSPF